MSDTKHKIIIAVDGFSSCGKSTFAKAIAARLGYIFIDTGAMYRAVTLYALEHGAIRSGIVDDEAVVKLLPEISITFRFNPERGASDIYVNGDLVEGKIRTIEVSNCVSRVSAIPEVRQKLVAMQQEMGRRRGVVMDGRDIGTVVFPDAELKLFMTADPAVRAERRYKELKEKGMDVTLDEIESGRGCHRAGQQSHDRPRADGMVFGALCRSYRPPVRGRQAEGPAKGKAPLKNPETDPQKDKTHAYRNRR